MSIKVPTNLENANPQAIPFLVRDSDLRGSYRVVEDRNARDSIHPGAKIPGMLVRTQDDGIVWQLKDDGSYVEFKPVSNTASTLTADLPLLISNNNISIKSANVLPSGGNPGDMLVLSTNNLPVWQPSVSQNGGSNTGNTGNTSTANQRATLTKSDIGTVQPGSTVDFDLAMAKTLILLNTSLNVADVQVQAFSTQQRDEPNPYTFRSTTNYLADQGISIRADNSIQYNRRFSILSNLEIPAVNTIYWRVENKSTLPITPILTLTFLIME